MSKDFTIMPQDYIVHYIKTDDMLVHTKDGDYAYHVKTERIPLIRCGECKYDGTWKCPWRNTQVPRYPSADDFCSYGERSEKPNNCKTCKWWEEDTNFCYSKADSDDHACHYEPKDEPQTERSE